MKYKFKYFKRLSQYTLVYRYPYSVAEYLERKIDDVERLWV